MSRMMLHGLGDCAPELNCGCLRIVEKPCAECERLRGVVHAQKVALDGYREEVERLQGGSIVNRDNEEIIKFAIIGTWLVEVLDHCTCGTGGTSYSHEPYCGYEPIIDLSTLEGFKELKEANE